MGLSGAAGDSTRCSSTRGTAEAARAGEKGAEAERVMDSASARGREFMAVRSFLKKSGKGKTKEPSVPNHGTEGKSFRGTTQIRAKGRALKAPVTEGGPAVSPRRLPGEPNGASQTGLQPAAHPLLARRDRYFPVHRK